MSVGFVCDLLMIGKSYWLRFTNHGIYNMIAVFSQNRTRVARYVTTFYLPRYVEHQNYVFYLNK